MADEELKDKDQDVVPEIEVDADEIAAEISPLDQLGNVVDAHITKDDDAATAAFHDYLTQKVKSTLNPEPVEDEVSDDATTDDDVVPDVDPDEVSDDLGTEET